MTGKGKALAAIVTIAAVYMGTKYLIDGVKKTAAEQKPKVITTNIITNGTITGTETKTIPPPPPDAQTIKRIRNAGIGIGAVALIIIFKMPVA